MVQLSSACPAQHTCELRQLVLASSALAALAKHILLMGSTALARRVLPAPPLLPMRGKQSWLRSALSAERT